MRYQDFGDIDINAKRGPAFSSPPPQEHAARMKRIRATPVKRGEEFEAELKVLLSIKERQHDRLERMTGIDIRQVRNSARDIKAIRDAFAIGAMRSQR